MPMTLRLPNKELTPQIQRYSKERSGRRRMVWRRKGVAGSKLKGGELRAVESGTAVCSLLCYAPALPPPQHPHLHPCSLLVQPLLHSGPAGMLTFNPHPPPLYFSALLLLHNGEKERGSSSVPCYRLPAISFVWPAVCLWMRNQRKLPSVPSFTWVEVPLSD